MLKEARSLNKIYLSDSDLDTLSYACAEAEMMWRRTWEGAQMDQTVPKLVQR